MMWPDGLVHDVAMMLTLCPPGSAERTTATLSLLRQYNLTPDGFKAWMTNKVFREHVEHARQAFTPEDVVKFKASCYMEDGVDIMRDIAHSDNEPGATRLKALDGLSRLAGLGSEKSGSGGEGGGRPIVHIVIPNPDRPNDPPERTVIDATPVPVPDDPPALPGSAADDDLLEAQRLLAENERLAAQVADRLAKSD